MDIEIKPIKSLVSSSIRAPNLIATLDGKVVGSYHGVGWNVQARVAGWEEAKLDIKQQEWEKALNEIEGSCTIALAKRYFANWAVRFPSNEYYIENVLQDLCLSAFYDYNRKFLIVKEEDTKYLEYLGVRIIQ